MNHADLLGPVPDVRDLVVWPNRVQDVARDTPLGIPVTLSTDPRHSFSTNPATAARAGAVCRWPESLGFAALRDPDLVERLPTPPGRSTRRVACGSPCTRRSTWPPSHAGHGSG